MDNFNLKKYLAENKLFENFEFTENDIDELEETAFTAGWHLGGGSKLSGDVELAFKIWNKDSMEDLAKNKLNEVDAEEVEYMGERGFYDDLHTNMVDFLKNNINTDYLGNVDELATDVVDLIANKIK